MLCLRRTFVPLLLLASTASTSGCASAPAPTNPSGIPPAVIEISKTEHPTVFIGEGRLSHAPEFVEFAVTIESECYDTPQAATRAADEAAAKVMKSLRGVTDPKNSRDGVFSAGGYSRPFERYIDSSRTVCRGTFAKSVSITAKASDIPRFQAAFPTLQRELLASTLRKPANPNAEGGITFARLAEPVPHLFHETRERIEQEALADALANAREKFEITAKSGCGSQDYGILRMVEKGPHESRPIPYAAVESSADATGIELDAIWINKTLEVSFLAEPGSCAID